MKSAGALSSINLIQSSANVTFDQPETCPFCISHSKSFRHISGPYCNLKFSVDLSFTQPNSDNSNVTFSLSESPILLIPFHIIPPYEKSTLSSLIYSSFVVYQSKSKQH
ncbi:hypothetical protein KIN20_025888 [Parelaphostrongylus tenuis]|uniref:Uncharacterized protein n=1 Tax=Parelaphostrongylus tenuis TaxID=148309 RepID=A0AAD5N9T3_PARTN|nr:hypothetical protein KIN20_025888 [Parelaphostrongylus tenuis]